MKTDKINNNCNIGAIIVIAIVLSALDGSLIIGALMALIATLHLEIGFWFIIMIMFIINVIVAIIISGGVKKMVKKNNPTDG